jgi:hypothetical protein
MRGKLQARLRRARQYLFLLFVVQGCALPQTHLTHLRLEPGASLADYHVFEVGKVTNATGQTFSFDVSSYFTDELESALRAKGYEVAGPGQAPAKELRIECSILSYSPASAGKKAEATALWLVHGEYLAPEDATTIKATLIDQQTGKTMADLISSESTTETGVLPNVSFGSGHGVSLIYTEKLILREAASGIASKIDEKIKQP